MRCYYLRFSLLHKILYKKKNVKRERDLLIIENKKLLYCAASENPKKN